MGDTRKLGQILLEMVGFDEEKIEEALAVQKERGGRIGEILTAIKVVSAEDVIHALSAQLDIPVMDEIDVNNVDAELVRRVPINFAKQQQVLPLSETDDEVVVAVADPLNTFVLDDVRILLGRTIRPVLAEGQAILDGINRLYDRASGEAEALVDDLEETDLDSLAQELEEPEDLLDSSDEAPIIRLVNSLLFQAVKERCSDIHIEPMERDISVRFRRDGILYEILRTPKRFQASITSRVKIMGGLNIAEKRLPQDGRIRIKIAGRDIDIRLSTIPTVQGERVVMRLLDKSAVLLDLNELGMNEGSLRSMNQLIHMSHGIVLVTGPTGSGKTTTLYAALTKINTPEINILTVEDPVEYQLPGIAQIHVNEKIDLTFSNVLRSFLRQDPDVIMVGEIRDLPTAEIAIQASLTGHLVFSTVHTNDASGAVTRLVDMGVEPFLAASSLVAILAQRLVRTVCPHCHEKMHPSADEWGKLGLRGNGANIPESVNKAVGCPKCFKTGYLGRLGIYELLIVDDEIRGLVLKNVDAGTIKRAAMKKGMLTLREDGADKIARGLTTIEEVLRVTQEDSI
ncbi:MAG: type II secretion system ATPase GspE [Deltaproteobacteria bacterium]|nr:type II secretion system ATPase GspE [Deltaproteobacteria bacterium]MBW1871512.1 type II secretion system ATPase GspE [Deltaproteobacteria bacterium]